MKKVAIVGTVGIPACYGGFESLVENLTSHSSNSIKYQVFCSGKSYVKRMDSYNNAELIYIPLKANGLQSIVYDIFSLIKCWFMKPEVVLILGVSGGLFIPLFKLFSNSRVITNIDGLEWKREKWNSFAKFFLKWSEATAVKFSDIVVTDNRAITDYVEVEYGIQSVTIAYGGDHAIRSIEVKKSKIEYSLALCRIEPENNVEMILSAFSNTDKILKFVGNWNSSEFGIRLKAQYSHLKNIELIDSIYNLDELYKLRKSCSLYIHGHSAGGTNPSLVEMMHFGVPIIAFDCSFNRYSTEDSAIYFSSSSNLSCLINDLSNFNLNSIGIRMSEVALERYTWKKITESYQRCY